MANLYDALLGESGDTNSYIANDPYYRASAGFQMAPPPRYMGTGGMVESALSNFLGGALQGYGRQNAMNTAYKDYSANPMLQQLAKQNEDQQADVIGPQTEDQTHASQMHNYLSATRPEGWTPSIGKQDLAEMLAGHQAQQALAQKKQEAQIAVQEAIDKRQGELPTFEQEQKIKGKYDPRANNINVNTGLGKDLPAATVTKVVESKALVDQAQKVADNIERNFVKNKDKNSWAAYQGSKMFSALDPNGDAASLSNLGDIVIRARSGSTAPPAESANLKKFLAGDITANPTQAVRLLRRFAADEASHAKSELSFGKAIAKGDLSGIEKEIDNAISGSSTSSGPVPMTAAQLISQGYKKVKGGWLPK